MPQRAFQAPSRSSNNKVELTCGTFTPFMESQRVKPGTFSSISPPPAEVRGPQQGGASGSVPGPGTHPDETAFGLASSIFLNCRVFILILIRGPLNGSAPLKREEVRRYPSRDIMGMVSGSIAVMHSSDAGTRRQRLPGRSSPAPRRGARLLLRMRHRS